MGRKTNFPDRSYTLDMKNKTTATYSLLLGSLLASSPSIRYTLPDMTYSKLSALEPPSCSIGFHSLPSGYPSSRNVVDSTRRNLSPKHTMIFRYSHKRFISRVPSFRSLKSLLCILLERCL